ncbi:hypothetical protein EVAR_76419_1 [Eumeta japonica]|uniref:Uncharacterized protein n=1 Tax=Eumeta variegata TaxID=151549 RepID=A0A4C1TAI8_EUMVA|nr:hypothetical protein EVAR_76419_1 [Eumeta japonica]
MVAIHCVGALLPISHARQESAYYSVGARSLAKRIPLSTASPIKARLRFSRSLAPARHSARPRDLTAAADGVRRAFTFYVQCVVQEDEELKMIYA